MIPFCSINVHVHVYATCVTMLQGFAIAKANAVNDEEDDSDSDDDDNEEEEGKREVSDTHRPFFQCWAGKDYYNPFLKGLVEHHEPYKGKKYWLHLLVYTCMHFICT